MTDEQQQVDRCEFWVHWSHLCMCSLVYLLSLNYSPWAGDLCRGLSLHWTLLERMRFQSCRLPVLSRTLCSSLFSLRKVLGSLLKQSCHLAKVQRSVFYVKS